jgi:hypothetical protein
MFLKVFGRQNGMYNIPTNTRTRVYTLLKSGLAGGVVQFSKGSKIPINYMTGQKDPLILEDKEYPDWVLELAEKQPSKTQLMKKLNEQGIDSLTLDDCKRLKRLITLEAIKTNNQSSTASSA